MSELLHWKPRAAPQRIDLDGRFVRLEPLSADIHGDALYEAATVGDADARFAYLFEVTPKSRAEFQLWLERAEVSVDPLFFAVIDKASGRAAGRQTLMRIDPANGVAEIGHIHWGPLIQRTPATTEALYLFARYIFDDLGYRRFEWKCNNLNEPSKRAALRFGFTYEGLFRKHMVLKGENRDTAWYAMTDEDWARLKPNFEVWLSPSNFEVNGEQKRELASLRSEK